MFTQVSTTIKAEPEAVEKRASQFAAYWPGAAAKSIGRLQRAKVIATAGVIFYAGDGTYKVQSESNPLGTYLINPAAHSCTCPDHGKHGPEGIICKHRLALALAIGWEIAVTPEQTPAPIPTAEQRTAQALANIAAYSLAEVNQAYDIIFTRLEHVIAHSPIVNADLRAEFEHLTALYNACLDRIYSEE
jgi:hypothetical protein